MNVYEQLVERMKRLARIRHDLKVVRDVYADAKQAFEQETADVAKRMKELERQEAEAYAQVTAAALEVARQTGDLRQEGIEIRNVQNVEYDEQAFIVWALAHAPEVLRVEVNKRVLTAAKAAELKAAGAPIEVVANRQPFIPTKLGHLLGDEA